MFLKRKTIAETISSTDVLKKTIIPIKNAARKTTMLPESVSVSAKKINKPLPKVPDFVKAAIDEKKSKKPIEILGLERKNLSFRNKNPNKIKRIGTRGEVKPKIRINKLLINTKDSPLFEKESKTRAEKANNPKARIV